MAEGKKKAKKPNKKKTGMSRRRKVSKRSKSAGASFFARMMWTIVLLVILVAALFYFTGQDPREIIPENLEHALSSPSPSDASEGSTPRVSLSPGQASGFEALLPREEQLNVIVLDVGQGNAVFVQTPAGKTMLVDAGESAYYPQLSAYLASMGVEKIDILVGTHPHSDHIGGMAQILQNYDVQEIYMPRVEHTSNTYLRLLEEIRDQGKKIHMAKGGSEVKVALDPDVTIRMLAPLSSEYKSLNDYSVALRLEYDDFSILLTGDAEKLSEKEMLENLPEHLPSTVMLLGHHGSSTSNTKAFLEAVSPSAAIISCGKDNDYGHPTEEVLSRLQKKNIPVYRTDRQGSVGVFCSKRGWEILTER